MGPFVEACSSDRGVKTILLGSGKGSQTQDVTFTASQVLEKARDRHNAGAVAQADIQKFHDCVPWGFVLKGLLGRGIPQGWARAALRLHPDKGGDKDEFQKLYLMILDNFLTRTRQMRLLGCSLLPNLQLENLC